jgi:hypothetical protein
MLKAGATFHVFAKNEQPRFGGNSQTGRSGTGGSAPVGGAPSVGGGASIGGAPNAGDASSFPGVGASNGGALGSGGGAATSGVSGNALAGGVGGQVSVMRVVRRSAREHRQGRALRSIPRAVAGAKLLATAHPRRATGFRFGLCCWVRSACAASARSAIVVTHQLDPGGHASGARVRRVRAEFIARFSLELGRDHH